MRILIVEDNEPMQWALDARFQGLREKFPEATIQIAGTLEAARRAVREMPFPTAMLLDPGLPDASAITVLTEEIDGFESRCPVVVITGMEEDEVRRYMEHPEIEVITKDTKMGARLLPALHNAVKRWNAKSMAQMALNLQRLADLIQPNATT